MVPRWKRLAKSWSTDLYYIKHMTLGLDLLIMFETVKTILPQKRSTMRGRSLGFARAQSPIPTSGIRRSCFCWHDSSLVHGREDLRASVSIIMAVQQWRTAYS